MNMIEIAPDGPMMVGTFKDEDGLDYVALETGDAERTVRLYYRLESFVYMSDYLREVADKLLRDKMGDAP